MLQVLQYLTGTSMAAVPEPASLIMTQSFIGGPKVNGSSFGSAGGKGWILRGKIWERSAREHNGELEVIRQDQQPRRERKMTGRCRRGKRTGWVSPV